MSDKTFTLAEATSLLPVLESLLRSAISAKNEVQAADAEFRDLAQQIQKSGGMGVNVKRWALRRAERERAMQRIKDALEEISAAGVQVKDLDIGLLDFPFLLDSVVVLLCWKLGEAAITHWHSTSEGFAGRKPIDGRFTGGTA